MGETSIDCPNLGKDFTYSDEVSEMIFGFLEEDEFSVSSFESKVETIDEEEEDEDNSSNSEESKAFWESQEEILQATLYRTTAVESKIRQAAKDALRELDSVGVFCSCPKMAADGCRCCRLKEICDRLQTAGLNCVICKSKWKSSPEIPARTEILSIILSHLVWSIVQLSTVFNRIQFKTFYVYFPGEHTYLEVQSFSKKGEVKVIIELNFRAEFQISRSSEEYNRLIKRLPDIFVGKIERLRNLIKILCSACKESMKERKMHMAPWRKHKYMQAKWLGTPQVEAAAVPPILTAEHSLQRIPKPRASMLTFDLFDNLTGMYSKAIRVI